MKRQHIFSLALATFLVLAGAVIAGSGRTDEAGRPAIGSAVEDFSLPGTDGNSPHAELAERKERLGADLHLGAVSGLQRLQRADGETGAGLQRAASALSASTRTPLNARMRSRHMPLKSI